MTNATEAGPSINNNSEANIHARNTRNRSEAADLQDAILKTPIDQVKMLQEGIAGNVEINVVNTQNKSWRHHASNSGDADSVGRMTALLTGAQSAKLAKPIKPT